METIEKILMVVLYLGVVVGLCLMAVAFGVKL